MPEETNNSTTITNMGDIIGKFSMGKHEPPLTPIVEPPQEVIPVTTHATTDKHSAMVKALMKTVNYRGEDTSEPSKPPVTEEPKAEATNEVTPPTVEAVTPPGNEVVMDIVTPPVADITPPVADVGIAPSVDANVSAPPSTPAVSVDVPPPTSTPSV